MCSITTECEASGLVPARTVLAALLLASASQAAGTCLLVKSEISDARRRQQASTSLPINPKDDASSVPLRNLLPVLGFRPTLAALAWGAAIATAAAAAVTACNALLGMALSSDPTAEGNTQALQAVLQASAASGDGGNGANAAAAAGAAWVLLSLGVSECVLVPLTEEVLFRGVLLRSLLGASRTHEGDRAAPLRASVAGWLGPLVAQAAVFATYHLSAAEWPAQFVLGLALGGGYVFSGGNLAASLVAHGLYNGAAVLQLVPEGLLRA